MYAAMALGAYRLIAEDLYQERNVALFFSLLAYGGALMLLPKVRTAPGSRAASSGSDPRARA
jgi:hypothetical protein